MQNSSSYREHDLEAALLVRKCDYSWLDGFEFVVDVASIIAAPTVRVGFSLFVASAVELALFHSWI
jgi:hypothetical protein